MHTLEHQQFSGDLETDQAEATGQPGVKDHAASLLGNIVMAVGHYYGHTAKELVGGDRDDLDLLEARNVMLTLVSELDILDMDKLARHFGREPKALRVTLNRLRAKAHESPKFRSHLEELAWAATGEPMPEAASFWSDLVAKHYDGLSAEELATGTHRKATEARQVRAYLLSEQTVLRPAVIAQRLGLTGTKDVSYALERVAQKQKTEPAFRRQLETLKEGLLPFPELDRDRMVRNAYDFYGMDPSAVPAGQAPTGLVRPRGVSAYLLREKLGLSVDETTAALGVSRPTVIRLNHVIKEEMAVNPMLVAEIDYIENAEAISVSINERIVNLVAEVTQREVADLMAAKQPEDLLARQMAMSLMAERGHVYAPEIAQFFGLLRRGSVPRAKLAIRTRLPKDPLLAAQLEWVRAQVLNDEVEPFRFERPRVPEAKKRQGVSSDKENELPEIDEQLVHPTIKEAVYNIVRETADFYGVPAVELLGREKGGFLMWRARRAASLRCMQAKLPVIEVAICFDNRGDGTLKDLAEAAANAAEKDRVFAAELESLARGEQRRDHLGETRAMVEHYYDLKPAELQRGKSARVVRARAAFLTIMNEYKSASRRQLGEAVGRTTDAAVLLIKASAKQLETDRRFRAEVEYLKNPHKAPKPPEAEDILFKITDIYEASLEASRRVQTSKDQEAKRMAAYILADELPLTRRQIAALLHCAPLTVKNYIEQTKQELAERPQLIFKIDELRPPFAASYSVASRVLHFVARRHKLQVSEVSTSIKAHQEAELLLQQYGGYSAEQTTQLLAGTHSAKPSTNGNGNGNGAALLAKV